MDEELRRAERAWLATGAAADEEALLALRRRRGLLGDDELGLAAFLGSAAAARLLDAPPGVAVEDPDWVRRLATLGRRARDLTPAWWDVSPAGHEVVVRAYLHLLRVLAEVDPESGDLADETRAWTGWLADRTEEHLAAAEDLTIGHWDAGVLDAIDRVADLIDRRARPGRALAEVSTALRTWLLTR